MNEMTLRQKAVVAGLVVLALYVGAALFWFLAAERTWRSARNRYAKAKDDYAKEEQLISEKKRWNDEYEAEKAAMPVFAMDKSTDTTWLQKMSEIAAECRIQITQRSTQEQQESLEIDDVKVMPVDADWEGSLEALVKFLYALENSDAGLFDIVELSFSPSAKPGYLRGSFTLNCMYMRE